MIRKGIFKLFFISEFLINSFYCTIHETINHECSLPCSKMFTFFFSFSCADDNTFSEFHEPLIKRYSISQTGSSSQLKASVSNSERTSLGKEVGGMHASWNDYNVKECIVMLMRKKRIPLFFGTLRLGYTHLNFLSPFSMKISLSSDMKYAS